jgi:8-oxo-dGTP pyrophosphatase MutT (NUDIX family)
MSEPVHPDLASTVVLLRSVEAPVEVLMLRRHSDLAFLAGAYVFPGGRVDDADVVDDDLVAGPGASGARIPGMDAAGERTLRVAAIRELVEEAGILLARRDGAWASATAAESFRAELAAGTPFPALVADEGWVLATDALIPFGWIVTPRRQPKRFDTHFQIALLPPGQEASHDGGESDDFVWIDPAEAIEPRPGELFAVPPPTWFTLALLAQHGSVADLCAWAAGREIEQIEPQARMEGEERRVTFPNDPLLHRWHGPEGIAFQGPIGQWRPPVTGAG